MPHRRNSRQIRPEQDRDIDRIGAFPLMYRSGIGGVRATVYPESETQMRSGLMRKTFALTLVVLLAACTVRTPAGVAILGPNPAVAGGTFSSPGGISVAAEVREIGGKTGVCGVWSDSENQSVLTRGISHRVLDPASVILGREAIVTGLQFLRKVPARRDYAGVEADCVVLERPWSAEDAARPVRINIPRQIVYEDFDITGAIQVVFRPGGPSAHPDDPKPWDN